jgi:2'-5' RNA ligase
MTQRRRLGVAVLIAEPVGTEIDGVRRAFGDSARLRIAPHVTLVPPVNVREELLGEAIDVVRSASASARPLVLELGPVATFGPASETAFLDVGGPGLGALCDLRRDVLRPPLLRADERAFKAHVTVMTKLDPARMAALVDAGAGFRADVSVASVHLLELLRPDRGEPRWTPIDEFPFAGRALVGRGGFETEITVARYGGLIDVRAVHQRRDVGRAVLWESSGALVSLDVLPAYRAMGVGTRLLAAVEHSARVARLARLWAPTHPFLATRGWTAHGGSTSARNL